MIKKEKRVVDLHLRLTKDEDKKLQKMKKDLGWSKAEIVYNFIRKGLGSDKITHNRIGL